MSEIRTEIVCVIAISDKQEDLVKFYEGIKAVEEAYPFFSESVDIEGRGVRYTLPINRVLEFINEIVKFVTVPCIRQIGFQRVQDSELFSQKAMDDLRAILIQVDREIEQAVKAFPHGPEARTHI